MTPWICRSLAAGLILAFASLATSEPASAKRPVEWFQYLTPFNCGQYSVNAPLRLVPGFYATAVMLYNAGTADVTLRKSLALAFPPAEQATGEVSNQIEDVIAPGRALEVDCEEILNEFVFVNPLSVTDHLQGFLVIESNRPLRVDAVYTTSGQTGDVSIDVERIAEQKVIPRLFAPQDRVVICHFPPGNPGNRHTIVVEASALPAHRSHGDTLGACGNGGDDGHDDGDDDD